MSRNGIAATSGTLRLWTWRYAACVALALTAGCGGIPSRVAVPPPPERIAATMLLGLDHGTVQGRVLYAADPFNALLAFHGETDTKEIDATVHGVAWRYYPEGTAPKGGFAGVAFYSGGASVRDDPATAADESEKFPETYPFLELGYTEVAKHVCWEACLDFALADYVYTLLLNVGVGVAF